MRREFTRLIQPNTMQPNSVETITPLEELRLDPTSTPSRSTLAPGSWCAPACGPYR